MKYFSLAFMILTLCAGAFTFGYTTTSPYTEGINFSCYSYEIIYVDQTLEVEAWTIPSNSIDQELTWSLSRDDIATIDVSSNTKKAVITPLTLGKVTITVSANEKVSKSFVVEIIARKVTQVTISTDCQYSTILTGAEYSFTSTVLPSNATFPTLVWTSSDDSVLSVDQSGNFKAESEGTATITATAHNGKSASQTFTVKDEIPVESIIITNDGSISLNSTRTLTYKVTPGNASVVDVTWSSTDEDIISITQEGKITALAVGSSNITVTNVNGKSYTTTITVPRVAAQTFRINTPATLGLNIGDTLQLSCYTYPSKVTDPITWKSSNADLISVDQNGLVTAHAYATSGVVITATCGDKTDTIIIFCASNY